MTRQQMLQDAKIAEFYGIPMVQLTTSAASAVTTDGTREFPLVKIGRTTVYFQVKTRTVGINLEAVEAIQVG